MTLSKSSSSLPLQSGIIAKNGLTRVRKVYGQTDYLECLLFWKSKHHLANCALFFFIITFFNSIKSIHSVQSIYKHNMWIPRKGNQVNTRNCLSRMVKKQLDEITWRFLHSRELWDHTHIQTLRHKWDFQSNTEVCLQISSHFYD